jgi:hypothetical protein
MLCQRGVFSRPASLLESEAGEGDGEGFQSGVLAAVLSRTRVEGLTDPE